MSAERRPETPIKPATARVFFALWPPANVADRLADLARDAALAFGGQPTRRDTIHLTLAFLGDVPEARLAELTAAAAAVRAPPFVLSLDRLGYWSHNHLLWAGGQAPPASLAALSCRLQQALAEAGFVAGGERRDFVPHVTLVRRVPSASAPSASRPLSAIGALSWGCTQFVLVRSRQSAAGSDYEIIDRFSIEDSATGGGRG